MLITAFRSWIITHLYVFLQSAVLCISLFSFQLFIQTTQCCVCISHDDSKFLTNHSSWTSDEGKKGFLQIMEWPSWLEHFSITFLQHKTTFSHFRLQHSCNLSLHTHPWVQFLPTEVWKNSALLLFPLLYPSSQFHLEPKKAICLSSCLSCAHRHFLCESIIRSCNFFLVQKLSVLRNHSIT